MPSLFFIDILTKDTKKHLCNITCSHVRENGVYCNYKITKGAAA